MPCYAGISTSSQARRAKDDAGADGSSEARALPDPGGAEDVAADKVAVDKVAAEEAVADEDQINLNHGRTSTWHPRKISPPAR